MAARSSPSSCAASTRSRRRRSPSGSAPEPSRRSSRSAPGTTAHISVSIGVATAPRDAFERIGLLRAADAALYRAKALGRNRVITAWGEGALEPAEEVLQASCPSTATSSVASDQVRRRPVRRRPVRRRPPFAAETGHCAGTARPAMIDALPGPPG